MNEQEKTVKKDLSSILAYKKEAKSLIAIKNEFGLDRREDALEVAVEFFLINKPKEKYELKKNKSRCS
jgi:hypothetical protein